MCIICSTLAASTLAEEAAKYTLGQVMAGAIVGVLAGISAYGLQQVMNELCETHKQAVEFTVQQLPDETAAKETLQ